MGGLARVQFEIHRVYTRSSRLLQDLLEEAAGSRWIYFHSLTDRPRNSLTDRDIWRGYFSDLECEAGFCIIPLKEPRWLTLLELDFDLGGCSNLRCDRGSQSPCKSCTDPGTENITVDACDFCAGLETSRVLDCDWLVDCVKTPDFVRGDCNGDGKLNVSDAVCVLRRVFASRGLQCLDASDANDDGKIDIADAIKTLAHLFANSGPLPAPFGVCGVDPTEDALDCVSFPPCQ